MLKDYSDELNVQLLIALLKAHNIKDIIVNPGATNVSLVASCQQDPFFNMYSCVDERSAAYMACGMAVESGNPVVLTCTGSTASRNYLSALTEAYYRKIPVLAVTSSRPSGWIGHDIQQVTDRRNPPPDTVLLSAQIPIIHSEDEKWAYGVRINEALLELRHHGGGPVHINLETAYSSDFSVKQLPEARPIFRIRYNDAFPKIPQGKIGVVVGSHKIWNARLIAAVEAFCNKYDAVVLCDQTSNYRGEHRILSTMVCSQKREESGLRDFDLLIHIGEITGATFSFRPKKVWRVSEDGKLKDLFRKLELVFEMSELHFFQTYSEMKNDAPSREDQLLKWKKETIRLNQLMPELPFSNMWIAQQVLPLLPKNSCLHLGIYNTLRSWDFFESPETVTCFCNTGGFGIDGNTSTMLGAALTDPERLFFGVVGDLSFFYDMNVLGNRHMPSNFRLIVVNNGKGVEFRQHINRAAQFSEDTDAFIAAAGHFGNQSRKLLKNYSENLGFEYHNASNKSEFNLILKHFVSDSEHEKPMIIEAFVDAENEDKALLLARMVDKRMYEDEQKSVAKTIVRKVIGDKGVETVKKILC